MPSNGPRVATAAFIRGCDCQALVVIGTGTPSVEDPGTCENCGAVIRTTLYGVLDRGKVGPGFEYVHLTTDVQPVIRREG